MASTPKRRRLREALLRRAQDEIGPEATEIEYIVAFIEDGGMLSDLASTLQVSRSFLSHTAHRLSDTATEQITAARRRGAHALSEEAMSIVDNAPETREGLQKAKLRSETRTWLASRWNPHELGEQSRAHIQLSIGQLHLDALRQRALEVAAEREQATARATLLPGGQTAALGSGDDVTVESEQTGSKASSEAA